MDVIPCCITLDFVTCHKRSHIVQYIVNGCSLLFITIAIDIFGVPVIASAHYLQKSNEVTCLRGLSVYDRLNIRTKSVGRTSLLSSEMTKKPTKRPWMPPLSLQIHLTIDEPSIISV